MFANICQGDFSVAKTWSFNLSIVLLFRNDEESGNINILFSL